MNMHGEIKTVRNFILIAVFLVILFLPLPVYAGEYFGKYSGHVQAEWLPDGRHMKLSEDFEFVDPNGLTWLAPKGSKVDGASIPFIAWSLIGAPFSGKYRDASVIHDIACQRRNRTWEVSHLAFYYAMRASNVDVTKAKAMYSAVYHFGPRWTIWNLPLDNIRTPYMSIPVPLFSPEKTLTSDRFGDLLVAIQESEQSASPLSLKQIQDFK